MDPEHTKQCVAHIRHCMAYKKIIMKLLEPFYLPLVLEKHIFSYVGFFPLVFNRFEQRPFSERYMTSGRRDLEKIETR